MAMMRRSDERCVSAMIRAPWDAVSCRMPVPDAVVTAVLRTLLRATVDAGQPVVLRSRHQAQAEALARWLAQAHGSRRTVIASTTARAPVEVRLPARMRWPRSMDTAPTLAPRGTGHQLSLMTHHLPDCETR
jgi:lauroyl/myristoyl acyltransferase